MADNQALKERKDQLEKLERALISRREDLQARENKHRDLSKLVVPLHNFIGEFLKLDIDEISMSFEVGADSSVTGEVRHPAEIGEGDWAKLSQCIEGILDLDGESRIRPESTR